MRVWGCLLLPLLKCFIGWITLSLISQGRPRCAVKAGRNAMTSRKRFRETLAFGNPDRVPYMEEGIRDEVIDVWRNQGLPPTKTPSQLFPTDYWVEIQPSLDPVPELTRWPTRLTDLDGFARRLDPEDTCRMPPDRPRDIHAGPDDAPIRMLRVHRGFFITMGVQQWPRFSALMEHTMTSPDVVKQVMEIQGRFAAHLADRILSQQAVEAAIFSEPIGGNSGPLISPRMYEEFVLSSYRPIMSVLQKHGVPTIIFRTYANARSLIGKILDYGFNCLWACEVNLAAMDYRDLRREFGNDLRLIGGIDLDALRRNRAAIDQELRRKLPPLLSQGGYIPLADGRIREDIRYSDYVYYRSLLQRLIG